jgi:hypothetical protein
MISYTLAILFFCVLKPIVKKLLSIEIISYLHTLGSIIGKISVTESNLKET